MGCFWSPQKEFMKTPGVTATKVGYAGGPSGSIPTYKSVCNDDGYIETVLIDYNSDIISYDQILDIFWAQDYETMRSQYDQYASVIFTHSDEQAKIASKKIALLKANSDPRASLPKLMSSSTFYPAEQYHDNYLNKQLPRYMHSLIIFRPKQCTFPHIFCLKSSTSPILLHPPSRYILLGVCIFLEVLPGVPQDVYKAATVGPLLYIALFVYEKFAARDKPMEFSQRVN